MWLDIEMFNYLTLVLKKYFYLISSGLPGMQVAAANAYGVPPSQSAQAAVAAVTAATAAAVNGQQMPPGVGGTQQAAGTAVQAALAAHQGAGLTAAAALAQQVYFG